MASMFPWSNPTYASVCFSAYRLQPLLLSHIDECELSSSASFILHLLTCTLSTGRYWVSRQVLYTFYMMCYHTFSQKPAHCFCHCYTFLSHPRLTSLLALFLNFLPAFRQFCPTHVMQLPAARLLPSGLSVPPEDFKLDCVLTLANSPCCTLLRGFTCLQQTVEQFHFFARSFVQRAFLPS